ncbi:CPBP family intramembrane glutamic endopeptidase [Tessaracoccus flavus]|uniref:CAAX prenyl protease 2/Lysostaphin resistance protein A-like domain-containing protein n=1 Tax=Tessaracoccus flavus TaxID=1610493 RepID=A0A1Q2CGG2_9ACTN|nr:CPBP family intramembrane glutamic endopeptidase [Tessaracoccus flavus]AQP45201.1 hypothetical protein RPIT_10675 [Tessaracoccus flavus]SDY53233.1 hypothetical protein SAMN05428934_102170 [Tessaracoccus flavus]
MAHAGRGDAGDTAGLPLFLILIAGIGRAFLLQGIHEEWWFRGFAFRGYRERPVLVLAATTVFFTLLHLVSSGGQQSASELFLYLALPLGMGFWAGVERLRTDTVWGAVGIHGGIHVGLVGAQLLGWEMGPAAWITIGLALCAAAMVRLVTAPKNQRQSAG